MPRLFVALDLPETLKNTLNAICRGIPGTRWLPPNQLHLTLRFIGDVDDSTFREIKNGLSSNDLPPISCHLSGIGCFPSKGRPRVIWVGVRDEATGLTTLQRQVEKDIRKLRLSPEERPFTPHITLARLKNPPREAVTDFLSRNADFQGGLFCVTAFHLYSSRLTPRGAIHTLEQSYQLSEVAG